MLTRRLILLAAVTLVPGLLTIGYSEFALRGERAKDVRADVLRSTHQAAGELKGVFEAVADVLETATLAPAVQNMERLSCSAYLLKVKQDKPMVSALGVADTTGEVRCSSVPFNRISIADRAYFKEALATNTFVVGAYVVGRATSLPRLPVAQPLRNEQGATIGVFYATIDLDWLQRRIEQRGLESGASLTIADREGVIIARDPLPERFIGTRIPDVFMHLVQAEQAGTLELTSQDGTVRLLAYVPPRQSGINLYVSSGVAKESAFRFIDRSSRLTLLVTLLSTAVSLVLAWLVATRLIRRPVLAMVEAIEGWRAGKGSRTGMRRGSGELAALGAALDELMDEIEDRQRKQQLASREMVHRVKNALAVVQALANQSFRRVPGAARVLETFSNRISALGRAYGFIFEEQADDADLEDTLRAVVAPFEADPPRFHFSGVQTRVCAKAAFALTLIFHELATNALKYGALTSLSGRVEISWIRIDTSSGEQFTLVWKEKGGPVAVPPERTGYGTALIESAFSREFDARVSRQYGPDGLAVTIEFVQPAQLPEAA